MKRWTQKEIITFVKMLKRGYDYRVISNSMDRSISSLQTMKHNIDCGVINWEGRKVK